MSNIICQHVRALESNIMAYRTKSEARDNDILLDTDYESDEDYSDEYNNLQEHTNV